MVHTPQAITAKAETLRRCVERSRCHIPAANTPMKKTAGIVPNPTAVMNLAPEAALPAGAATPAAP